METRGRVASLFPGPVIDQNIAGAVMMLMEMAATGVDAVIVNYQWLARLSALTWSSSDRAWVLVGKESVDDSGAARR